MPIGNCFQKTALLVRFRLILPLPCQTIIFQALFFSFMFVERQMCSESVFANIHRVWIALDSALFTCFSSFYVFSSKVSCLYITTIVHLLLKVCQLVQLFWSSLQCPYSLTLWSESVWESLWFSICTPCMSSPVSFLTL